MRVSKTRERPVIVVLRMRGQYQDAVEWPCGGWEQAVQKARRVLPHFEQRNPWLYFDSQQQKLYVLLDPETEPFPAPFTLAPPRARAVTKKEARL